MNQRPVVVRGQQRIQLACAARRAHRRTPGRSSADGRARTPCARQDRSRQAGPARRSRTVRFTRGDGAQHTVDETRSRRIEFDCRLLDGGGHRGVRVDPRAQQLVGAEPQQVEQHRVDAVRRPSGGLGDDGVEQPAGAARTVGQFGGEGGVTAGDAAFAQQRRATRGWRRRRAPRPPAARRTPRGAPGRAAFGAASRGFVMTPLRIRRVGHRAPMSAASICFLPGGWTRAKQHGLRRRPDPDAGAVRPNRSRRQRVRCRVVDRHRPEFDPQLADQGPRAGVGRDRADPPLDDMGGQVPAHPGIVDRDLRCDGDAVGRLRYRRQRSVGDAVQCRLQQRGTRNRQPVKQIARGIGRPDRLGDDTVDGSGVQCGLDLERGGAGHRVACRDRRLHRRRTTPGRQQREVQVDPAVLGHGQQAVAEQRPVRHDRACLGRQFRQLRDEFVGVGPGRPQHRDAVLERQLCRPAMATAWPAGPRRRPGA